MGSSHFLKKLSCTLHKKKVFISKKFSSLPCFPVPPLLDTLKKFLTSTKPFLSSEEYCCSEEILKCFGAPGGEGEFLQCLILERAEKMDNWLTDWWQKHAYFDNRNPLILNTITGLSFPVQRYKTEKEFLECASKIAAGALQFKKLVDENKIPQECIGDQPLDMSQYKTIFGTCRVPHDTSDYLVFNSKSDHITVAYKNNFYKVTVKEGLAWQNHSAIFEQLKQIVTEKNEGPPVGLLTSECRDTWYNAYNELTKNHFNCESIKVIEESLFLICLDTSSAPKKINIPTSTIAHCIHGSGPNHSGSNRWFDKTLQFIVGKNGEVGLAYEGSPAEIQVILMVMNFINRYMETAKPSHITSNFRPEKLKFEINKYIQDRIKGACCNFERLIANQDLYCFKFNPYGIDFLNSNSISADSYIQMAIQLAYYRLHLTITPQFQLVSIRQFKDGRNEVIRCCSEETTRFVCAMECSTLSPQSKANALYTAIKCHQELVNEVMQGEGIDNHLFGLRMIASENRRQDPQIFCTPAYQKTSQINLNTYQWSFVNMWLFMLLQIGKKMYKLLHLNLSMFWDNKCISFWTIINVLFN
ncbi:carnitine O-acetyltransferase isoform X2 [Halyomorpha halys]|uniref:carnitine O-acetyltransferase isoform X2 n=1 Tax=Halyomorpha halys TaxID=286706 RepID=UPI0034D36065